MNGNNMRNFTKLSVLFFLLVGILACNNRAKEPVVEDDGFRETVSDRMKADNDSFLNAPDHYKLPDSLRALFYTPDSILRNPAYDDQPFKRMTPENRRFMKAYIPLFLKLATNDKDGNIILDLSLEEFRKTGLPDPYYYYIMDDLRNMNFGIQQIRKYGTEEQSDTLFAVENLKKGLKELVLDIEKYEKAEAKAKTK